MKFDPNKPFDDLPLLPPGTDVETKPVLKQAIAANRALAEYLKELEKTGILTAQKIGRETLYLNDKLYELLSQK